MIKNSKNTKFSGLKKLFKIKNSIKNSIKDLKTLFNKLIAEKDYKKRAYLLYEYLCKYTIGIDFYTSAKEPGTLLSELFTAYKALTKVKTTANNVEITFGMSNNELKIKQNELEKKKKLNIQMQDLKEKKKALYEQKKELNNLYNNMKKKGLPIQPNLNNMMVKLNEQQKELNEQMNNLNNLNRKKNLLSISNNSPNSPEFKFGNSIPKSSNSIPKSAKSKLNPEASPFVPRSFKENTKSVPKTTSKSKSKSKSPSPSPSPF
jgi:chromosome segregation ATPase